LIFFIWTGIQENLFSFGEENGRGGNLSAGHEQIPARFGFSAAFAEETTALQVNFIVLVQTKFTYNFQSQGLI
jgi:hypothetical protein